MPSPSLLCPLLLISLGATEPTAPAPLPPGLCEASGAVFSGETLLVVDDDRPRTLFRLRRDPATPGALLLDGTIPLPDGGPDDLEGLTRLGDTLVATGSFGRSRKCKDRPERARLLLWPAARPADAHPRALPALAAALQREPDCLAALFVAPPPAGADALCRRLVEAERGANQQSCPTLNVEAIVADGASRLWLGLRRPLLDGRAVLLRVATGADRVRFDAVATVSLGPRGLRDAAVDGATLLLLAGPVEDGPELFTLEALPLDALVPGATLTPASKGRTLPRGAEAIAPAADGIWLLTDGGRDDKDDLRCRTPPLSLRLDR